MIARNQTRSNDLTVWTQIAASVPPDEIQWRQDGRPVQRDGKYFARFVAYIDAQFVRERLDEVFPGEWDLTLELLPASADPDGVAIVAFKARLQILGVIREDVGFGGDYKAAASDAFKRAAMRFGIGHELYRLENNWVQVDGDGKYAKPLVDPIAAYEKRHGPIGGTPNGNGTARSNGNGTNHGNGAASRAPAAQSGSSQQSSGEPRSPAPQPQASAAVAPSERSEARASDEPQCPSCGGRMWDNSKTKSNPRAPDFKCRNRQCEGVYWPGEWPPSPPARPDQLVELMQLGKSELLRKQTRDSVERRLVEHIDKKKVITQHQAEQTILELKNRIAAAKEKEQRETPLLAGQAAPNDAEFPAALKDPADDGLPF